MDQEVLNPESQENQETPAAGEENPAGVEAKGPEASPGSLLTEGLKETGEKKNDEEKAGSEEKKEADPLLAVPEKPEGYEANLPEGTEVDEEMLEAYRGKAHELGLNQKQFQELAGLYADKVKGVQEQFMKAQSDQVMQAGKKWAEEIMARPGFKEDKGHAQRALAEFGSKELIEYFDASQAGSYPPIFEFVAKVGRALAEPRMHGSGSPGKEKSAANVLYPSHK